MSQQVTCGNCGRPMWFNSKLRLWTCQPCGQMGGNCTCKPENEETTKLANEFRDLTRLFPTSSRMQAFCMKMGEVCLLLNSADLRTRRKVMRKLVQCKMILEWEYTHK